MNVDLDQLLREHNPEFAGAVRQNTPLAQYTHVRIGGPARFLVEPFHADDVATIVQVCRKHDLPLYLLGGGSNVLISDEGVEGVVMRFDKLQRLVRDENRITADAGASLPGLLRSTRQIGLGGLEILTGIPAQVGGAVAMNAGTRDGETFDRLVDVKTVESDGEIKVRTREECTPRYRNGNLGDSVVVSATFELEPDSPQAIYSRFEASLKARNASQPVTEKSVGCVFQNPEGDAAGRLIERAGCKLMQRGAVQVSGKHANYFVHDGSGTAAEFLALAEDVREKVKQEFGVDLEFEVKRWGMTPV